MNQFSVKRMALDFSWPLKKIWKGYVNPYLRYRHRCHSCYGQGYSKQGLTYRKEWYGDGSFDPVEYGSELLTPDTPIILEIATRKIDKDFIHKKDDTVKKDAIHIAAKWLCSENNRKWCCHLNDDDINALVKADRLFDFTRVPINDKQKEKLEILGWVWLPSWNGYTPNRQEVNDWAIRNFGHDDINRDICVEARCKRNNEPVICDECDGSGEYLEFEDCREAFLNWKIEEPPAGNGYQLWNQLDQLDQFPISPVFNTPEKLADWLARTNMCHPSGKKDGNSTEEWLSFIKGPNKRTNMFHPSGKPDGYTVSKFGSIDDF